MPAAKPLRLAVTLVVPVLVPEVGLTLSQPVLSLTVHERVPPPVLEMLIDLLAGFVPPTVTANERFVALYPMVGDVVPPEEEVIVTVTGMVFVIDG